MRSGLLPKARYLVLPARIHSSGFRKVHKTCKAIGIEFDRWQRDLNEALLAVDSEGLYAADTVGMSIPRQVGKTFNVGAIVFALCINNPGLTVIWTAHRFKVSRETFMEMRGWAYRDELQAHVDAWNDITTGNGNECITFLNKSRIVFAARERGSIRGFTKVGVLVLDEAQILTEAALADLVPTTNQSPNPLIILMGTPPKPIDPSEVFTRLRDEAIEGVSDDILWVELAAEKGADPMDRRAWSAANPSYPSRTPEKAILRMRKLLSAEDFAREALGIWDDASVGPISVKQWKALSADRLMPEDATPSFFVAAAPGNLTASIAVAFEVDGELHGELVDHGAGVDWLVSRIAKLAEDHSWSSFTIENYGAVGSLLPALADAGVEPDTYSSIDMGRACGHLQNLVNNRGFTHSPDPLFVEALMGAVKRGGDEGLWTWGWRKSSSDITPLVAITGALWAAVNAKIPAIR